MTTTELVVASQYSRWDMGKRASYAKMLAGARALLPSGLQGSNTDETAARVFLALETGDMLGIHPMAAVNGIDVIEGNPTISPQLALGLIRKAGHKVRIVETGSVESADLKVTVTVARADDDEPIVKSYTLQDAVRAGLCTLVLDERSGNWNVVARSKNGNPLNWEKYPADMCQWRAVGRMMRAGASDVMLGVSYFPEELEATVDADGVRAEVVDEDTTAEIIARIKGLDDKKDMADLWHELNRADQLTEKIDAEFAAHLSTLTKDSRPPKSGAPGQTGIKEIDAPTETGQTEAEPTESEEFPPTESYPASEAPERLDERVAEPVKTDEPRLYAPGEALAEHRGGFNASALAGDRDE